MSKKIRDPVFFGDNTGADIISQTVGTTTSFLGYDGHGSTRTLTDAVGAVTNTFHFDGYGMDLGWSRDKDVEYNQVNKPATDMLYSGEQYDTPLQMQSLRARYYDQNVGGFNRLDPWKGNVGDPQSYHKYTYCHGDPINGIDPSGKMNLTETLITTFLITYISLSLISTISKIFLPKLSEDTPHPGGKWFGFFTSFSINFSFIQGSYADMLMYGFGCKKWVSLTTVWVDILANFLIGAGAYALHLALALAAELVWGTNFGYTSPIDKFIDVLEKQGGDTFLGGLVRAGASLGLGPAYAYGANEKVGDLAGVSLGFGASLPIGGWDIIGGGAGITWGFDSNGPTGSWSAAFGPSLGKSTSFGEDIDISQSFSGVISYTWINNIEK